MDAEPKPIGNDLGINVEQWKTLLAQHDTSTCDTVPPGWLRREEICELTGKGRTSAYETLRRLVKEGKVEVRPFKIWVRGACRRINHYRIKP